MRSLLLTLPLLAAATTPPAASALPEVVLGSCTREPATGGLVHLRCGPTRLLVVQTRDLDEGTVHEEILESLLDLVPGRIQRREDAEPDLLRSIVEQARDGLGKDEASVRLVVTSRQSTGRSAACIYALDGRRRTERQEEAWCRDMTRVLLPAPEVEPITTIQVIEPDLPDEDLSAPSARLR